MAIVYLRLKWNLIVSLFEFLLLWHGSIPGDFLIVKKQATKIRQKNTSEFKARLNKQ